MTNYDGNQQSLCLVLPWLTSECNRTYVYAGIVFVIVAKRNEKASNLSKPFFHMYVY